MLSQFYTISVVLLNNSWNNPRDNIVIMLEVYTSQETRVFAFWFSLIPFFLEFNGLFFFFYVYLILAIDSFIVTDFYDKRERWTQYCAKSPWENIYIMLWVVIYPWRREEKQLGPIFWNVSEDFVWEEQKAKDFAWKKWMINSLKR